MKCIKCGHQFDPTDILVMEDDEEPVCDTCELLEECFIITYNEEEYIVQAADFVRAVEKWRDYVQRKMLSTEVFELGRFEVRKVENVVVE